MKALSFPFYPKQWLGDDNVMLMSWDARGMHMHFMCIAWQQDPPCTLPNDDAMLRRLVGNPRHWERLKTEIFRAWRLDGNRWVQEGLLRTRMKQDEYRRSRQENAAKRWKNKKTGHARADHMHENDDAHGFGMHQNDACSSSSLSSKKERNKNGHSLLLNGSTKSFDLFWKAYPRKRHKGDAEKAWANIRPDDVLLGIILGKLDQAKRTRDWLKEDGAFIPYPATWLNAKGWEDEYRTPNTTKRLPL